MSTALSKPSGKRRFSQQWNCENSTVSTTTARGTCKPAQHGHRSPCLRTAAGESRWSKQSGPWDKPTTGKSARLAIRDIDHLVQQLEKINGLTNCLDHERLPVRHDRDVDDLDETATAETPQFAVRRTRIDHRIRKSSLQLGKREILPKSLVN